LVYYEKESALSGQNGSSTAKKQKSTAEAMLFLERPSVEAEGAASA
jgi:hypothetical protein